MTYWLQKGYVTLGVIEDYAHICGLAEKIFFIDFVKCLILHR
jgi:hypothetical protein